MRQKVIQLLSRLRKSQVMDTGIESGPSLMKWTILGTLIGIVAGLGAIVFTWAIDTSTHFFLGDLVGYTPPSPAGEGTNMTITPILRMWALPMVTGLGGLLSGIIVFNIAPEAEGHGTDAAIASFHYKGGAVRARVPLVKLIASAITIGTGGSGGREGPTAQISSAFGSLLATWLKLDTRSRRTAMATGMGAGIGSIFRAPLGGAVMAAEILYKHDLEVEALLPALIASIVGYTIYAYAYGFNPVFGSGLGDFSFSNPIELIYYAILGVICGVGGLLYAKMFILSSHFWHKLKWPNWVKPAIGGLIVGSIGIFIPGVLHMGYGWVQLALDPKMLLDVSVFPLWLIILLPIAKMFATSISIGSGGSGGIFGPGMVIGGMIGAAAWRFGLLLHLPGFPASPVPFVVIAMMALFGGIAHAPLAVMLMVAEMTGNLSLLAPAMVTVSLASILCGNNTIYVNQVDTRADSPAHRYRFSFPLLSSLSVGDVMKRVTRLVYPTETIEVVGEILLREDISGLPITTQTGTLIGVVTRTDINKVSSGDQSHPVSEIMTKNPVITDTSDTLDEVLELLARHHISWLPVVNAPSDSTLAGIITAADVAEAYRSSLNMGSRRLSSIPNGSTLLEIEVTATSAVAGRTIRELKLPQDALIVSVRHKGEMIFPHGNTHLQSGDIILVITTPLSAEILCDYFGVPVTAMHEKALPQAASGSLLSSKIAEQGSNHYKESEIELKL